MRLVNVSLTYCAPRRKEPPRGGVGFPTVLERDAVNLAEVQETFRVGERDVMAVLREARATMTADLMQRLRDGKVTARNLDGLRRSNPKGKRRMMSQLRGTLTGIGERGFVHVQSELEAQDAD